MLRRCSALHAQLGQAASQHSNTQAAAGTCGESATAARLFVCRLRAEWTRGVHTFASLGVAPELVVGPDLT